jgi:cobalt-zinc-cadmium efflux system protein
MALTLGLTASYMVAEVVGGLVSGSLALLADAGHMLSDVAALGLSLFAMAVGQRPPDPKRTYGYARTEILAALINGAALLTIAAFVTYEAVQRFATPRDVEGPIAMGVAAGGLLINVGALWLLSGSRQDSLNTRGAWLHVMSDALGSIGALTSGALIWAYGFRWADPAASLLIALLISHSAYQLLRETTAVLMESAPEHVDVEELQAAMEELSDVESIHDLHVWTIEGGTVLCSLHVVTEMDASQALSCINDLLRDRFGIHHATVQVESAHYAAEHCPGCELVGA